ncbi:MAG TPA: hypothetical protein PLX59_02880 [Candidatus Cloacimonadota bacterium]|nr:hypothetical protein [Candidatus Cloacimonadota bacterium]
MKVLVLVLLLIPVMLLATMDAEEAWYRVNSLIDANRHGEAYELLKNIQSSIPEDDPNFPSVVDRRIGVGSFLGYRHLNNLEFDQALQYNLDVYNTMLQHRSVLSEAMLKQEYVLVSDILEAYFSKGDFAEANRYRAIMYNAHNDGLLPDFFDNDVFWFDVFAEGEFLARGYEDFTPLPEDRVSTSFSKIIYHITKPNEDGSDREELFQLHILMFHGSSQNFDYVMTWRQYGENSMNSQTLYQYTYKEKIDYIKLHSDIREVVKMILNS